MIKKHISLIIVLFLIFQPFVPSLVADEGKRELKEARNYKSLEAWDSAIEKYDALLLRTPKNPELLKEAAYCYDQGGYYKKAAELYERAVFLQPYDNEAKLAKAQVLYRDDQKAEAVKTLETLIQADPDYLPARKQLATYLNWENKWDGALKQYDAILEREPGNLEIEKERAQVLNWSGKWDQAAKAYDQVLAQEPDNIQALKEKAQVLNWSGKWKEAIPIYEELVQKNPDDLESLKELALLYSWTQQWDEAQDAFNEYLAKSPSDAEAREELAHAYYYDEKYDSARTIYNQLAESNPDLARRLDARISDISVVLAPTLAFEFLFYNELNRREGEEYDAQTYYYTTSYTHPFSDSITWISTFINRHDNTINSTSQIYGQGFQVKIWDNMWYSGSLTWEPRNFELNPRWGFANSITWRPIDRVTLAGFQQFTSYWDHNISQSAGFGMNYAFLDERDLVFGYRFSYDTIKWPSDYFMILKDNGERSPKTITNTLSLEKYWNIYRGTVLTTGTSYQVNTQARNTISVYGYLSVRFWKRFHAVLGTSFGRDNDDIIYYTASGYLSYRF